MTKEKSVKQQRFGKEDEREGAIGDNRLREIFKDFFSKRKIKDAFSNDVYADAENSFVRKLLSYVRAENPTIEDIIEAAKETKQQEDINNAQKIKRLTAIMEIASIMVFVEQQQKMERIILEKIELNEKELKEKKIKDDQYSEQLAALQAEQQRLMLLQKLLLENELYRKLMINHLNKEIANIHFELAAARTTHVNEILKNSDKVVINGKKFFEGMNEEQRKVFIEGRLLLLEMKEKKLAELNAMENNEKLRASLAKDINGNTNLQYQLSSITKKYQSKRERLVARLEEEEREKLRDLVRETGCKAIDPNLDAKSFDKEIKQYDEYHMIKKEQTAFIERAKSGYEKIEKCKTDINILDKSHHIEQVIQKAEETTQKAEETIQSHADIKIDADIQGSKEDTQELSKVEDSNDKAKELSSEINSMLAITEDLDGSLDDLIDTLGDLEDFDFEEPSEEKEEISLLNCNEMKEISFSDLSIQIESSDRKVAAHSKMANF